jgi:hypothetical protein
MCVCESATVTNIKIPIRSRSYDFKIMKGSVVDLDLVRSGIV